MAYQSAMTFWNGCHPMASTLTRLYTLLVPSEGRCDTVEGELIRAFSRINHDYNNNGFGNNWSGAYNFLDEHLGLMASERRILKPYARGKARSRAARSDDNDPIARVLNDIGERVVERVHQATAKNNLMPNGIDMLDLQEKDF